MDSPSHLTTGQCATLACLLEVTAPKPGNVHRGADFDDTTLNDFMASAVAIGPVMQQAARQSLGRTVGQAVQATQAVAGTNTNLGMVLLFAPLAMVPSEASDWQAAVQKVLQQLTADDARRVYDAICQAQPGGLQPADVELNRYDVRGTPPPDLLQAMHEAAAWDLVARQYVTAFADVLTRVVPWLADASQVERLPERIVWTHVRLMSETPDSLIARKCGAAVADEAAARAAAVLQAGPPESRSYHRALADLDFWLRSDGRRRNPGTTADLIAAGLFVALRRQLIGPPY